MIFLPSRQLLRSPSARPSSSALAFPPQRIPCRFPGPHRLLSPTFPPPAPFYPSAPSSSFFVSLVFPSPPFPSPTPAPIPALPAYLALSFHPIFHFSPRSARSPRLTSVPPFLPSFLSRARRASHASRFSLFLSFFPLSTLRSTFFPATKVWHAFHRVLPLHTWNKKTLGSARRSARVFLWLLTFWLLTVPSPFV